MTIWNTHDFVTNTLNCDKLNCSVFNTMLCCSNNPIGTGDKPSAMKASALTGDF